MPDAHLLIVGASAAGHAAEQSLRQRGHEGSITILGAEIHKPYSRPPLSKDILTGEIEPESVALDLQPHAGTTWRFGVEALRLDLSDRRVQTNAGPVGFDRLLIATGAAPRLPEAWRAAGVRVLRTVDDAVAVREASVHTRDAIVIGAGFIGTEVAAGLRERGLRVDLVEAGADFLAPAGREIGRLIAELHEAAGVVVHQGRAVTAVERHGVNIVVMLDDGTALTSPLVVAGIGVDPRVKWLEGSGLTLDDGVLCDEHLLAEGGGGIVAVAGDVARAPHPLAPDTVRVEHWGWARAQGEHAARSLMSDRRRRFEAIPSFASAQFDSRVQVVGFPQFGELSHFECTGEKRQKAVARYERGGQLIGFVSLNNARAGRDAQTALAAIIEGPLSGRSEVPA